MLVKAIVRHNALCTPKTSHNLGEKAGAMVALRMYITMYVRGLIVAAAETSFLAWSPTPRLHRRQATPNGPLRLGDEPHFWSRSRQALAMRAKKLRNRCRRLMIVRGQVELGGGVRR